MKWFYNFIKFFVRLYICSMYKVQLTGCENIPKDRGFMMASNHVYAFDPILLALGTKRHIRFLAKAELGGNKNWGWFFKALGTISVERGKGSFDVMEKCAQVIEQGDVLGIFPEGTRSKGHGFLRPKSGMSVIAKMAKADILPCLIEAPADIKFRDKITVKFGKLIPYDTLEIEVSEPRTLKAATKKVWGEITSMADNKENDDEHRD